MFADTGCRTSSCRHTSHVTSSWSQCDPPTHFSPAGAPRESDSAVRATRRRRRCAGFSKGPGLATPLGHASARTRHAAALARAGSCTRTAAWARARIAAWRVRGVSRLLCTAACSDLAPLFALSRSQPLVCSAQPHSTQGRAIRGSRSSEGRCASACESSSLMSLPAHLAARPRRTTRSSHTRLTTQLCCEAAPVAPPLPPLPSASHAECGMPSSDDSSSQSSILPLPRAGTSGLRQRHVGGAACAFPLASSSQAALFQQKAPAGLCQVPSCCADLAAAKFYHRRYKICEMHARQSEARGLFTRRVHIFSPSSGLGWFG